MVMGFWVVGVLGGSEDDTAGPVFRGVSGNAGSVRRAVRVAGDCMAAAAAGACKVDLPGHAGQARQAGQAGQGRAGQERQGRQGRREGKERQARKRGKASPDEAWRKRIQSNQQRHQLVGRQLHKQNVRKLRTKKPPT